MVEAQNLVNDGIDANNDQMQGMWSMMPSMAGMDDLLEKHFKFTSIVSCTSSMMNDGSQKIKLDVKGTKGDDNIVSFQPVKFDSK